MHQWFLSYQGQQMGPLDHAAAVAQATRDPSGHCWRQGFPEWIPISACTELRAESRAQRDDGAGAAAGPAAGAGQRSDVIDYRIYGEDMQFVEIELDPGETRDRRGRFDDVQGFVGAAWTPCSATVPPAARAAASWTSWCGAGKRLITGESLFTTVFTHTGASGKAKVAFAAPYPGTIVPMTLTNYGGTIIAQKDSFLCAARGVQIGIFFQKKIMTGAVRRRRFHHAEAQRRRPGVHPRRRHVVERELRPGERLDVDTGCVVAMTSTVNFDVQPVGGVKSMLFGGEGVFLATLTGPGKVWLQSLPFSRLAGRMFSAAYQTRRQQGRRLGAGWAGRHHLGRPRVLSIDSYRVQT